MTLSSIHLDSIVLCEFSSDILLSQSRQPAGTSSSGQVPLAVRSDVSEEFDEMNDGMKATLHHHVLIDVICTLHTLDELILEIVSERWIHAAIQVANRAFDQWENMKTDKLADLH